MDKVQKIRKGIERLKSHLIKGACASQIAMETRCKEEAYNEVLVILDSLQEEPVNKQKLSNVQRTVKNLQEEPVSDDLEEAAITAADKDMQGRQIMEESNEKRQLYSRIFRRGFKDGTKWDEQQKAKDAIDCEICEVEVDTCGCGLNSHTRLSVVVDDEELRNMGFKDGDKCKVVILKDTPEYIDGVKGSYTTTTKFEKK